MKIFFKAFLCLAVAAPMATSCYDDSELWDEIAGMKDRLDQLEVELTSQTEALNALLSNGATLTSCKKNEDGSYTVTLSNGTKFNVLPEGTDFSSLVTYTVVDGKKCWATYDATGNPVVLTDASGNAIPLSTDISVKIEDGVYYLVINGKEYVTGYDAEDVVQVFSSCSPLTDASGNVYAVKFTFGEGMEVTVTLDGYAGVIFKLSSINKTVVSEYYIDYGATQSFLMDMQGVVDYVMQVPDGWRVKEVYEELTGETYIKVTAPSVETVALGAAVAEGDLKVVSVVEGGKATVSKMYLSTDPFKTYEVSSLKAVIEPYAGIQKFAYGLMSIDGFDKSQVTAKVNELLTKSVELPAGFFISENGIDKTYEEMLEAELSEDMQYVFWSVPALYREEAEGVEAGFYAVEDMVRFLILAPVSAKIEVTEVSLLDAKVKVNVGGTLSMYAGTAEMSETVLEEIVYMINNGGIDPITEPMKYEGSVSEFPTKESGVDLNPDTKYVVWVVPTDENKETYTAADIVYKEFSTKSIAAGGTIELTVGEFTATASTLSATLSSENAAMIYYTYMSEDDGKLYSTASNETKMSKILGSGSYESVIGTTVEAVAKTLHPESTKWLYAVAVGHDGLYGEVVCKSAKTEKVTFNSLSLTVEEVLIKDKEATLKVNVSGGEATDFIYWAGYEGDPFWASEAYCGKSRTTAQKYMAANPDAEQIAKVMRHNGAIAADGTITLTDLSMNTSHVFLVLAKDASGNYSKAGYIKFQTLAANLGELVLSDNQKWIDAKKFIEDNLKWDEGYFHAAASDMGYASYAFDIKIPTDLTAFITCFGTEATQMTDIIVEIEEYASRKVSVGKVVYDENGNQPTHPDWYDDNGKFIQGSLVNIYDMYPHGSPTLAAVTYFSKNGHEDGHCSGWDDDTDSCSNYDYFIDAIENYCSLQYWKDYIVDFGNYSHNNDPTHEYSRTLKDPARIEAIAQQYLDIYYPYYKDAVPMVYVNDGSALHVTNREAMGPDDDGVVIDTVTVVLKDGSGNYYQPIYIPVPNYFK